MFITPISSVVKEVQDPTLMTYLGTVEDNKDPEMLQRIKVVIPPYEGFTTEELPWACPILGGHGNSAQYGGVHVPEVGSQVRITFPSHDLSAPFYTGAEQNKETRTTLFDEDYPESYGFKDSKGNFIKVNKKRGTIIAQHKSTSNVRVAPDGSMQISLSNGAYFTFSNKGAFDFNVGAVQCTGSSDGTLDIKANSDVNIKTQSLNVDAKITAFTGDVSVGTGASGVFWAMGQTVTVKDGIVVSIQ